MNKDCANYEYLSDIGKRSKKASYIMAMLDTDTKNKALLNVAKCIKEDQELILKGNETDYENAIKNNMSDGLKDRLKLTPERIDGIIEGIRQVAELDDPVGRVLEERDLYNGLHISKVAVPMGVVGIIYESRPNVTPDAFALCFKSGNVSILKGGKDCINSNIAIVNAIKRGLREAGVTEDATSLIEKTDRQVTTDFMTMNEYVNVIVPRGGAGLIKAVVENSNIPVIETGTGNCHIYVDEKADIEMAANIVFNAKTQRIGVCNAAESLVVNEKIADKALPAIYEKLKEKNVELRGDDASRAILKDINEATDEDFYKEYLDYIMSVKVVKTTDEAIDFINEHSTGHSEAIISEIPENIDKFLKGVDSACVYANCSTRFTDGFEFGLGAEIGISTQKLHARGPMGLKELCSYKYTIRGNGQVRG